jgi:hypothetical protein
MAKKMTKAEQKAAIARYKKADKALQDHGARVERQRKAAGIRRGRMQPDATYYRLNAAVNRLEKDVPWWRR